MFVDEKPAIKMKRTISTSLFTEVSRPKHIRALYEKAAAAPVVVVNGDDQSEDFFLFCSPVMGRLRRKMRKKIDVDIETRVVSFS